MEKKLRPLVDKVLDSWILVPRIESLSPRSKIKSKRVIMHGFSQAPTLRRVDSTLASNGLRDMDFSCIQVRRWGRMG